MARLIKRWWPLLAILLVIALAAVYLVWPAAGNAALEIGALLLVTFLAVALTRLAAMQIVPPLASAAEAARPGLGLPAGFGAGLLLALGIGVCVSLVIRFLMQKIRAIVI